MTLFKSMIAYFRFFTRIYIPGDLGDELYYLNHGSKFLPIFGLIMGAIEGAVYYVCNLALSGTLSFVIVLLLDVCLTGAMHQDGFADLCDGVFSSRKQDRMLEIMKDSRLGTMGTLALIFYYLFMVLLFNSYESTLAGISGFIVILMMNVIGKSNIAFLVYKMKFHNATNHGLGQIWSGVPTSDVVIAQLTTLILLGIFYRWMGLILYLIQVAFLLIYRRFIYKKLGGFNGDALGGNVPVSTVIFLFSVCVLGKWL